MQLLYRFPDDGSIEYRISTYSMVLTNALALARLRGETYTREEIHQSTVDNIPLAKKFISQKLTPEIISSIDESAAAIRAKIDKSKK